MIHDTIRHLLMEKPRWRRCSNCEQAVDCRVKDPVYQLVTEDIYCNNYGRMIHLATSVFELTP